MWTLTMAIYLSQSYNIKGMNELYEATLLKGLFIPYDKQFLKVLPHYAIALGLRISKYDLWTQPFRPCSQPPEGRDEERRISLRSTQISLPTQRTKSHDLKKKKNCTGFSRSVKKSGLLLQVSICRRPLHSTGIHHRASEGGRLCWRLTEKKESEYEK